MKNKYCFFSLSLSSFISLLAPLSLWALFSLHCSENLPEICTPKTNDTLAAPSKSPPRCPDRGGSGPTATSRETDDGSSDWRGWATAEIQQGAYGKKIGLAGARTSHCLSKQVLWIPNVAASTSVCHIKSCDSINHLANYMAWKHKHLEVFYNYWLRIFNIETFYLNFVNICILINILT